MPRASHKRIAKRVSSPETTRKAMLFAAMDAIAEVGYYRASSNEIARRSGFTWGVIQHHFKSREGLLGAVIDYVIDDVLATLCAAKIEGRDLPARVRSFCALLMSVYAEPRYVATLQILLDLARDPKYGGPLRATVRRMAKRTTAEVFRLAREVRPDAKIDEEFAGFLSDASWGLSVMEHVGRIYWSPAREKKRAALRRAELVTTMIQRFKAQ